MKMEIETINELNKKIKWDRDDLLSEIQTIKNTFGPLMNHPVDHKDKSSLQMKIIKELTSSLISAQKDFQETKSSLTEVENRLKDLSKQKEIHNAEITRMEENQELLKTLVIIFSKKSKNKELMSKINNLLTHLNHISSSQDQFDEISSHLAGMEVVFLYIRSELILAAVSNHLCRSDRKIIDLHSAFKPRIVWEVQLQ